MNLPPPHGPDPRLPNAGAADVFAVGLATHARTGEQRVSIELDGAYGFLTLAQAERCIVALRQVIDTAHARSVAQEN